MLLRLFIAALWSPAGKGLTSWLSFVMFNCVFVTFPCAILGQVWYLIVTIPDFYHLSYLDAWKTFSFVCVNHISKTICHMLSHTISFKSGMVFPQACLLFSAYLFVYPSVYPSSFVGTLTSHLSSEFFQISYKFHLSLNTGLFDI